MHKDQAELLVIMLVVFAALCVLGWLIGLTQGDDEDDD